MRAASPPTSGMDANSCTRTTVTSPARMSSGNGFRVVWAGAGDATSSAVAAAKVGWRDMGSLRLSGCRRGTRPPYGGRESGGNRRSTARDHISNTSSTRSATS